MVRGPSGGRSLAAIAVLEANDVVLTQVGAGLYLDDVHRDLAWILDAMAHTDRDVGRLVLLEQEDLVPAGDAGGPGHDDPVLGSVVMHLQRQGRPRLHLEALHLEARTVLDAVVAAPRTENLPVQRVLVTTL